jgi:hypothetical protein
MVDRTQWTGLVIAMVFALGVAGQAQARNTEHLLPVKAAAEGVLGKERLLAVPFYFKGQPHAPAKKTIGEWSTNKTSRGAFRSDEVSCEVAFLSAVIQLQQRAQAEGGDAIIDVVSITRGQETTSATEYRCVAGAMVVHVGLKGTVVNLK